MNVFERAKAYARAAGPAVSGSGGHSHTFALTMALVHGFRLSAADSLAVLQDWNAGCLPPWSACQLRHKIQSAARETPAKPAGWLLGDNTAPANCNAPLPPPAPPKWPAVDPELVLRIAADGGGLADLWEASPVRFADDDPRTEDFVDALFPPGALLCCGKSATDTTTMAREDWRGQLANLPFIVANPMSALIGTTKAGTPSNRSLDNTGPRRFMVVECDFKPDSAIATRARDELGMTPPDVCAAILLHLAQFAPLAMAVHSGKKSVHGWFPMAGTSEADAAKFFRAACIIGADHALWTRCQLCRMPDGKRETGERQKVYFFNNKILGGQLC